MLRLLASTHSGAADWHFAQVIGQRPRMRQPNVAWSHANASPSQVKGVPLASTKPVRPRSPLHVCGHGSGGGAGGSGGAGGVIPAPQAQHISADEKSSSS